MAHYSYKFQPFLVGRKSETHNVNDLVHVPVQVIKEKHDKLPKMTIRDGMLKVQRKLVFYADGLVLTYGVFNGVELVEHKEREDTWLRDLKDQPLFNVTMWQGPSKMPFPNCRYLPHNSPLTKEELNQQLWRMTPEVIDCAKHDTMAKEMLISFLGSMIALHPDQPYSKAMTKKLRETNLDLDEMLLWINQQEPTAMFRENFEKIGPSIWSVIHTSIECCVFSSENMTHWETFFNLMWLYIGCGTCSVHCKRHVSNYPPPTHSRKELRLWAGLFHNAASLTTKRRLFCLDLLLERWHNDDWMPPASETEEIKAPGHVRKRAGGPNIKIGIDPNVPDIFFHDHEGE